MIVVFKNPWTPGLYIGADTETLETWPLTENGLSLIEAFPDYDGDWTFSGDLCTWEARNKGPLELWPIEDVFPGVRDIGL